jgi:hypothetical protein
VCVGNVKQYANHFCAACNGETRFSVGNCSAPRDPAPLISTCLATPTNTSDATALRNFIACHSSAEAPVCGRGENYKNQYCALCNGLARGELQPTFCAASDQDIVTNCTKQSPTDFGCTFFSFQPVCETPAGITYKNMEW